MQNYDSDQGLTETMNQAAREYHTVLINNAWMNFKHWQNKLVRAELANTSLPKTSYAFVTKKILQRANRATAGPDPLRYKSSTVCQYGVPFLASKECKVIIERMSSFMRHVPSRKTSDSDWDGVIHESHIKKHPWAFVQAGALMVERMCNTEIRKNVRHVPQIIPQLPFRLRSVTFGKEQTLELCKYICVHYPAIAGLLLDPTEIPEKDDLVRERLRKKLKLSVEKLEQETPETHKFVKASEQVENTRMQWEKHEKQIGKKRKRGTPDVFSMSLEQWRAVTDVVFNRLFLSPRRLQHARVVTTDGIGASWHVYREQKTQKGRAKANQAQKIDLANVTRGHLGLHGKDVLFQLNKNSTIISVDPGHSNIVSLVRQHPYDEKISTFELKNTTWRSLNGSTRYKQSIDSLHKRMGVQKAIDILSGSSSRNVLDYDSHVRARLQSASIFCSVMELKNPRRWKFEAYKTEQRAVHKLVTDVLGKKTNTRNTLVVWGNGSFGPTSKGHASAPNKKMQREIARFVPLVLVNEFNTSKKTNCCELDGVALRTKQYKKRTTVFQCPGCKRLLPRDVNAAMNILCVFLYQAETQSGNIPLYLQNKS
jgi:hypothetical protein